MNTLMWCSLYCDGAPAIGTLDFDGVGVPVCDHCLFVHMPIKQAQNTHDPRLDTMVWESVEYD